MQDYYKAWDSFDVDAELEKLEQDTPQPPQFQKPEAKPAALPRSKIVVRGGRSTSSELDRLKDQGRLHFIAHEYE